MGAVRVLKRRASNTIVLTGLSGSGKTVLFYQVNMQERVLDDLNSFPLFSSLSTIKSLIINFIPLQLRDGSSHQGTVTSMEPNEETFVLQISETTKVMYLFLCPSEKWG